MSMNIHPDGPLADALVACGVVPEQVTIERDDLCQEDVLTFGGDQFSAETLARLAELSLKFPNRFVFATDALQDAFEAAVMTSPAMLKSLAAFDRGQKQQLEDAGLASFAAFDRASESLGEFASRVETACGFGPGELLAVQADEIIIVQPQQIAELPRKNLGLVHTLLMQSAPDVPVLLTGTYTQTPQGNPI